MAMHAQARRKLRKPARITTRTVSTIRIFADSLKGNHSRDHLRDDVARHVGQTKIAAARPEGQPLVVQPQAVEDGRLKVVHGHRVLDRVNAEVVGPAYGLPALDAA